MIAGDPRSEQVISAYKRHKLSHNALYRIRQLLQQFEREREFDRRVARYGVAIILAVLLFSAITLFSAERIVLF